MKEDSELKKLIDKVNYEDDLCKDAESRYLSYPEGSEKANFWYNDMNRHYQAREEAEKDLMAYRKEHEKDERTSEQEIDTDLEK